VLDYELEAQNAERLAANFADQDEVVVPRVFRALSTPRVLVLEHLHGQPLLPYLDACTAEDRDRILTTLVDCFCAQVLDHGVFHADPHPGNFLVLPGPRLGLLDFGAVMTYTPAQRRAYAELCAAVLAGPAARVGELLAQIGFSARGDDPDAMTRFAQLFLEAFRTQATVDLANIDPKAQLERALELMRQNPIVKVPSSFVLLGRVFGALGGLVIKYRPRIQLLGILGPHLARAMRA
jgi:predicted unusual protein kinase regulating ubiquinone biosynthesis (AarF/ABC1/UbiB family)